MRAIGHEEHTLFIVLADHQRLGKGTLYHGIRTPMVLQFPSRVPAGQTLPASVFVSSLDIFPTVLDAAGLLPDAAAYAPTGRRRMPGRGVLQDVPLPYNAGARMNGRSLLPLLRGGLGFDAVTPNADAPATERPVPATPPPDWWRADIYAELGYAATVKHHTGWQLVAMHLPEEATFTTQAGLRGTAREVITCELERLRTGAHWASSYTHARHCVWRDTNHTLTTNLIGDSRVRFDSTERYSNFHRVEQLLHTPTDLAMQRDLRARCPRQLMCMQESLRAHLTRRVHFDGDAAPFGVYTSDAPTWSLFTSGGCRAEWLALPPERCNEGMAPEVSAMTCDELRTRHAPSESERREEVADEEVWSIEPHAPPECAASGDACTLSGCCAAAGERCFTTLLGTAHCKGFCHADDTWECRIHMASPPPPPSLTGNGGVGVDGPFGGVAGVAAVGAERAARWQRHPSGGADAAGGGAVCAESASPHAAGGGCSGALVHRDARDFCHAQGARLCTAAELRVGVAAGSGCGLDGSRVWTADFCGFGDEYFLSFGGGSSAAGEALPDECLPAQAALPVRCCADAFRASSNHPAGAADMPVAPALLPSLPLWSTECARDFQNCYPSRCCRSAAFRCFQKYEHIKFAQCRPHCPSDGTWACLELSAGDNTGVATGAPTQPIAAPPSPTPPGSPGIDAQERARAQAKEASLEGHVGRLALFASGVLTLVCICACCLVYMARDAAQRQVVRDAAQGVELASGRTKRDGRADGLAPTAYVQMKVDADASPRRVALEELLPVHLEEEDRQMEEEEEGGEEGEEGGYPSGAAPAGVGGRAACANVGECLREPATGW